MDIARTKQLAGLITEDNSALYNQLQEVVQLPEDLSIEDLLARMEHCKKALSLCAKLKDPADKKKWLSATFVNLNKVQGALKRLLTATERQMGLSGDSQEQSQVARPQAGVSTGTSQGPSPAP